MKRWLVLSLIALLLPSLVLAASQQLVNPGTSIKFYGGATGSDVVWTPTGIAIAGGRASAWKDKGAGAQPALYDVHCVFQYTVAPVVGGTLDIYIATSVDNVVRDGPSGTTDATLTSATNDILNLKWIFQVVVDKTSTATDIIGSTQNVWIPTRYFRVAFVNNSSQATSATANSCYCTFTPMPLEMNP